MPKHMNLTTIKFKRINPVQAGLRFIGQPTDEVTHKKTYGPEIETTGQVVYNDFNKWDPSFAGDMEKSAGFIVLDAEEIAILEAVGTPMEKSCRLTELAGVPGWYTVHFIMPQGHTTRFAADPMVAVPTIYRCYFVSDTEVAGGEKRI